MWKPCFFCCYFFVFFFCLSCQLNNWEEPRPHMSNCWFCQFSLSLIFDHNNLMCALCAGNRSEFISWILVIPVTRQHQQQLSLQCIWFDFYALSSLLWLYNVRLICGLRQGSSTFEQLAINLECVLSYVKFGAGKYVWILHAVASDKICHEIQIKACFKSYGIFIVRC